MVARLSWRKRANAYARVAGCVPVPVVPPTMMARAKAKAEAEAKARAAADPRLAKAKADAEAKAAEAKAKAEAKAAELDAKHGISSKAEAKAAEAKKAADIKMHGKVAELFYEFDADASGYLDGEPASTTWWTPAAGATPETTVLAR